MGFKIIEFASRIFIAIIAISTITMAINPVIAWNDCPLNLTNDPYPGECNKYIDTDKDGICDLSQPPPEERIVAQGGENSITPGNIKVEEIKEYPTSRPSALDRYNVVELLLVSLFIIAISEVLVRIRKNTKRAIRFSLNVILLITSAFSAIFGLLVLFVEPEVIREYSLIFWHVEFSIVATVIGLHHILKRYKYFIKYMF